MPTIIVEGAENQNEVVAPEPEVTTLEAIEAAAEAAVEIAEIEADKQIAVEEIRAETEQAAIEERGKDRDEWQQNLEARLMELQTQQAEQSSTLSSLTEAVRLLTNHPPVPEQENLEVMQESLEAPEPEQPKRKQRFRLI